jgi:hypothetical protein
MSTSTLNSPLRVAARGWWVVSVTPTQMGIAAGLLAVAAGAFFEVRPPEAYGVCTACHGRDLVNWTINAATGTRLFVAEASALFPLLTTVGVLLGAFIAARTSGEFRSWTPDHPAKTFIYGALVMNCALIAGGCSLRLLLRAAAADGIGALGFGGMAAGVVCATAWLRWRASR